MIALIEHRREDIARLCHENGVRCLAVFGSAAKGTWRPGESDIDVLIDLDYGPGVGRRYMRFSAALERLLGAPVGVVTERSVDSEWFRQELEDTASFSITQEAQKRLRDALQAAPPAQW